METQFNTQAFDVFANDKMEELLANTCIEAAEELGALDIELSGSETEDDLNDSICVGYTTAGRNIWVDESTRTRSYTANAFKLVGEGFSVSGYIKPIEVASMVGFLSGGEVTEITERTSHTNALVQAIRAKVGGR